MSNRFLSLKTRKNKRVEVLLSKNGQRKTFFVHRLVALTYIPNPNELPQVNHKDENPQNNCVDNLEWCNCKYNANYGTRNERLGKAFAKPFYCIELDKTFESMKEAEQQTGVRHDCISNCCRGKQKTTGGYHWRYA